MSNHSKELSIPNIILNFIHEIENEIRNIQSHMLTYEIVNLTKIYNSFFDSEFIASHVDYKLTQVYKSGFQNYPGDKNLLNSYFHIKISLASEEAIFLNSVYDNKLTDLIDFFKSIFQFTNTPGAINAHKLSKWESLLKDLQSEIDEFIEICSVVKKENKLFSLQTMNIAVNKIYFRNKKDNWLDFRKILDANNIQYFYHFTDHRNIENIKSAGGLYSWLYLEKNNIKTYSGGNNKSRERDIEVGFENYVRLSFVKDHPMKHICVGDKRIKDPITLCISTDVAYISDTWFSNKNANRGDATIFNQIEKFKELKFDIFSKSYFDVERSSFYQAEILVPQHIPLSQIININEFD